ncbi:hypothetical protein FHR99_003250 [Litorivivens lipolytica]|uniref:Uncharacterized protein n=1 Tax=Litorivivens lipolytica TaxID=1524264 RepID=A0A7W4Z8H6_9GAMM|nr:hypothetical protein [Litorivivens lipolytica]MBB3048976.1 hypothetical protein [Litorivivens lipolytica]
MTAEAGRLGSIDELLSEIANCDTLRELNEIVSEMEDRYRAGELDITEEQWPRISAFVRTRKDMVVKFR